MTDARSRKLAARCEMKRELSMASRAPALPTTQRARAIPPRNAPASPATLAAGGTQTEPRLPLPKHTRSPIAKARRQQIKRQKAKGRKPLATPIDAAPRQPVRHDRLARATACAYQRGVAAERANAKERRFAARTTKKVPKRCQRPRGARRCEPHAVVRRRGCETCRALRARSISGHQRAARSACGQMKVNERQITCRTLRVRSISGQPTCRALRVRSACVSSLRLTYDRSTCVSSPRLTCAREECVSSQRLTYRLPQSAT